MSDADITYNLWRMQKTVLQMCRDRGYLVLQDELDQSFDQFKEANGDKPARSDLKILVPHNDDQANKLVVQFCDKETAGVKEIREYCEKMINENITTTILVVQKSLKHAARDLITDISENLKLRIEIFLEDELLVNITEHQIVPKYVILTSEEKQELLQKYRLKENQLPRIQSSDRVARYFGLTRGQVVRISRASEIAGHYTAYRLVA